MPAESPMQQPGRDDHLDDARERLAERDARGELLRRRQQRPGREQRGDDHQRALQRA